jgi:hypothetical protein
LSEQLLKVPSFKGRLLVVCRPRLFKKRGNTLKMGWWALNPALNPSKIVLLEFAP